MKGQDLQQIESPVLIDQRRRRKSLLRKRLRIEECTIISISVTKLIPMLRSIVRSGCTSFHSGEIKTPTSDMTGIVEAVHSEIALSKVGGEAEGEVRAITGLCHFSLLRSALDVLVLRLALEVRERIVKEDSVVSNAQFSGTASQFADDVMNTWEGLDSIIEALVLEVRIEVERDWRVDIKPCFEADLTEDASRRRIELLERYFDLQRGPLQKSCTLTHLMTVMAKRYQKWLAYGIDGIIDRVCCSHKTSMEMTTRRAKALLMDCVRLNFRLREVGSRCPVEQSIRPWERVIQHHRWNKIQLVRR